MGKKQMGNGEPTLGAPTNGNGMGTLGDKLLEAVEKKDNGVGKKDKKKKGESIEKRISGGLKIAKGLLSKMEEMYKYHLSRGEEISFSDGEIPFDEEFVSGFADSISEAEKGDKSEKNLEELGGCIRELRKFVEIEKPEIKIVDPSKMLDYIFSQDEFSGYLKKKSNKERAEEYKGAILEQLGDVPADELSFVARVIEILNARKGSKPGSVLDALGKIKSNLEEEKVPARDPERRMVSYKSDPMEAKRQAHDFKEEFDENEIAGELRKIKFEKAYKGNTYERKDKGRVTRITVLGLIPGNKKKYDKIEVLEVEEGREVTRTTGEDDFFIAIEKRGFVKVEVPNKEDRKEAREKFKKEYGINVIYRKGGLSFTVIDFIPGDENNEDRVKIKDNDKKGGTHIYTAEEFNEIIGRGFRRVPGVNEIRDDALAVLENANKKFMDFLAETASQNADPDMINFRKKIRDEIYESADKLDRENIPIGELKELNFKLKGLLKVDLKNKFDKFKENEAKSIGEKSEDSINVSEEKTDSGDGKKEEKAEATGEISKEIEEKFRLYEIWTPTKKDVKESLRVVGHDKDSKGKEIFSVEFGKRDGLKFKKEKSTKISRKRLEEIMKEGGYRILDISKAREIRSEKFREKYGEDVWYIKYEDGLPVASFKIVEFRAGKARSGDVVVIEGENGKKKEISIKDFEDLINEGYEMDNGINQALSDTRDADEIVRKNKLEEEKKAEIEALRKKARGTGTDKDNSPEESDNMPDREKGAEDGFSEKEKKIMEGSEKIAAAFIEDQKNAFDFENFPKGRLAQLLEIQAVKFLMDKFRARNIFSGKEEDVAEMIVGKIKDKF